MSASQVLGRIFDVRGTRVLVTGAAIMTGSVIAIDGGQLLHEPGGR